MSEYEFFLRASALSSFYGSLPYDCLKLHVWAERKVAKVAPTYPSLLSRLWEAVCGRTGYFLHRALTLRWRLFGYLGHPLFGNQPDFDTGEPERLVNLGYAPSLSDFSSRLFEEPLSWEPLDNLFNTLAEESLSGEQLESVLGEFAVALQEEIAESVAVIEASVSVVNEFFQEQLDRIESVLQELESVMSFQESQFIAYSDGAFFFPFRDPSVQGIQVIPSANSADVATDPAQPFRVRANLFDLICAGFHSVLAYMGADRLPRGIYLPGDDSSQPPQWKVTNLADHVAELHQTLNDLSACSFQVRTGTGLEDVNEVRVSLNDAVSSIAGAVSEIALDAQRAHLLSAQAARTALTVSNQLGTAVFPGAVDLGWRGTVYAPSTSAATIAQVLASIESALNDLSISLGVAPRNAQL